VLRSVQVLRLHTSCIYVLRILVPTKIEGVRRGGTVYVLLLPILRLRLPPPPVDIIFSYLSVGSFQPNGLRIRSNRLILFPLHPYPLLRYRSNVSINSIIRLFLYILRSICQLPRVNSQIRFIFRASPRLLP